jgi:hypothetical protein
VDVSYTAPSKYEPIEGKETLNFKDTGIVEMDGLAFKIEKVLSSGLVQVKCGASDCTDMSSTKGLISPNCGEFSDYFNQEVNDAAAATGDVFGSFFKGFTGNMGTIFLVIGIIVLLYFAYSFFGGSKNN